MAEFKPGETVQLKSGGPVTTIARLENIDETPNAVCGWIGKNLKKEIGTFPLVMLKHAGV